MIIVVSPAKSLDYESPLPTKRATEPRLLDEAADLVGVMATKTPDDLRDLMSISPDLAELNVERFHDWSLPFTPANARPAVFAFDGDVYQGLDAYTFDGRDLTEAQKTLRMLSGLYGVLRPLDLMQPYRLEMGTRLATDRGKNLYDYWGDTIADVLAKDLADSPGPDVLVNLASIEYFKSVRTDRIPGDVVAPVFLDAKGSAEPKVVSFWAKRARGTMARWLVTNRVRTRRALREFDADGYRYDAARSTDDEPVFVRVHPA